MPHLRPTASQAQADTRAWLERAVIGLNLCPFAKSVHVKGQVRYVVSADAESAKLLDVLVVELKYLAELTPSKLIRLY